MLTNTGSFSEDTQAQVEDATESATVVVEASLPCPVAEIPASNVVEQQPLAITPAETVEVHPSPVIEAPANSEVEEQLIESTTVVLEALSPCSIAAGETPTSSEEQQPSAIAPAEALEALNTDRYVFFIYEMSVG